MEDDQNGGRPEWKMTIMENNQKEEDRLVFDRFNKDLPLKCLILFICVAGVTKMFTGSAYNNHLTNITYFD